MHGSPAAHPARTSPTNPKPWARNERTHRDVVATPRLPTLLLRPLIQICNHGNAESFRELVKPKMLQRLRAVVGQRGKKGSDLTISEALKKAPILSPRQLAERLTLPSTSPETDELGSRKKTMTTMAVNMPIAHLRWRGLSASFDRGSFILLSASLKVVEPPK